MTLIERLTQLHEQATPGPWDGPHPEIMSGKHGAGSGVSGPRSQGIVEAVGYVAQPVEADLFLIVALRNALPALIAYCKAAGAMQTRASGVLYRTAENENFNAAESALLAALNGGEK